MRILTQCTLLAAAAVMVMISGCSTYKGDFVQKTEAELALMEKENEKAHNAFLWGNYTNATNILNDLTKERTVSRPLYQLEKLSVLLLSGKHDEAHKLIMSLHEDLETLVDTQLEEKAQSVWHGEVNKVYKGDSYERATFYALMALSFIRNGNYNDAIRSVKNGLLSDADSNAENAIADYALLHYLGFFCSKKLNNNDDAMEYLRGMNEALKMRGYTVPEQQNGKKKIKSCFDPLLKTIPNVLLVVWTGQAPTVVCTGQYKEKRSIIRGSNPFDSLSVSLGSSAPYFVPNQLADIEYQATTRGGRLMDDVLNDQATAKKTMEVSRNILLIVGTGLLIAAPRVASCPPVALGLLGGGIGCYILGGTAHIVGKLMNPAADGRYWRNLPGQFFIVPLSLPPGKHQIMLTGHKNFDAAGISLQTINIPEKAGNAVTVIHTSMMSRYGSTASAIENTHERLKNLAINLADSNRLMKELK